MSPVGFPKRLIIGSGSSARVYKVAGTQARTPRWQVSRVPSQEGDPWKERAVPLGDGSAGLIGSHRHLGRPSAEGVADVTNGDTSVEDRYGAGPGVTTISLTTGSSLHAAGSIGGSLTIGGGGAPSIGGGTASGTATAIWSDGADSANQNTRYIYALVGGRLKVVDPTSDAVVETTEWSGVDGGDAARWAGAWWIARRGGASDYVKAVVSPYVSGGGTVFADADYVASNIHAGPDAIYRAYSNFSGNAALIKKSTSTTVAAVDSDTNWAPSSGETMGDPGVATTRLATLGEDLVVGKRDGLYEFDASFTARTALEWMRNFQWEHNCNAILPLGQNREVMVSFRRGLYYLPLNQAIGTEVLTGNDTDKKGRYAVLAFDGNWVYSFLNSPATDDTHIVKMRPRRLPGPGLFEHHPIATRTDKEVLAAFIWPGATVGSTVYGPRLYWGDGTDALAYIRLGETQPDVFDANARFTTGAWTIQWPHDDYGSPQTLKMPYKVEGFYEGVTGTTGITWAASVDDGAFTNLDADGSGSGTAPVTTDGFAQRFGPRDNSLKGREIKFRVSGTGGAAATQQAVVGTPIVTILEQPEMIDQIEATLELDVDEMNDEDAELQWRTIKALSGQGPQAMIAEWGDNVADTTFYGRVGPVERSATVTSADAPGVILASIQIRALDFTA